MRAYRVVIHSFNVMGHGHLDIGPNNALCSTFQVRVASTYWIRTWSPVCL